LKLKGRTFGEIHDVMGKTGHSIKDFLIKGKKERKLNDQGREAMGIDLALSQKNIWNKIVSFKF